MLATLSDVSEYLGDDNEFIIYGGGPFQPLRDADAWVRSRIDRDKVSFSDCPPAVTAATALLAAVFHVDPDSLGDEARIPNMVRVMLVPWAR